jgi:hypothetical protein
MYVRLKRKYCKRFMERKRHCYHLAAAICISVGLSREINRESILVINSPLNVAGRNEIEWRNRNAIYDLPVETDIETSWFWWHNIARHLRTGIWTWNQLKINIDNMWRRSAIHPLGNCRNLKEEPAQLWPHFYRELLDVLMSAKVKANNFISV